MPQKLNLHIVGGDFFDDNILFAIVITTKIMDSFCLRDNHNAIATRLCNGDNASDLHVTICYYMFM